MKECPLGIKCNRNNPIHFSEYTHAHLNTIFAKGINTATGQYEIPTELNSELVLQQLELLAKTTQQSNSTEVANNAASTSGVGITAAAATSVCNAAAVTTKTASSFTCSSTSPVAKKPKIEHNINEYIPVVVPKGQMAQKLERAAPYNIFQTAITDSTKTHQQALSVTMQELLDESLGLIECSLQINFMIDIGWLLGHYYFAGILERPLLVLYGDESAELLNISKFKPQVTAIKVQMSNPFATSHTKMMLFGYSDGAMRIVISTANLYADDWHNRAQALWISPKLAPTQQTTNTNVGESPTGFRADLLRYLETYNFPELDTWLARIRKTDFSAINVFLIASVPGSHARDSADNTAWGMGRLGHLLQQHCTPKIDTNIPIVCQSSSLGSLGPNVGAWLEKEFLLNLSKHATISNKQTDATIPPFKLIYPSLKNVRQSHDGLIGGGCLPYFKNVNEKQLWLKAHLQQWKSNINYRSQSMPHLKTYARFNVDEECLYWFVLTSANLSKSAWGTNNKNARTMRLSNYEAGVLFLPGFVLGEDNFPLFNVREGMPPFPMPYDLPLTPYEDDDVPFLMDYIYKDNV